LATHTCDCEERVREAREEEAMLYKQLDKIIEKHKDVRGPLIQVLHAAQELFGWLPEKAQVRIAKGLGIPLSEVHGVLSFYSFFTTVPRGKHTIRVCLGTACYVRGGKQVLEKFQKELGIGVRDTTEDRQFSLELNRCVGACGLAPVVTVGEDIYRRVKIDKIPEIIRKYANGESRGS
jgi:NADH:ubiquinone oxidoreductase subunit E